jgi:putative transcriptional regulator
VPALASDLPASALSQKIRDKVTGFRGRPGERSGEQLGGEATAMAAGSNAKRAQGAIVNRISEVMGRRRLSLSAVAERAGLGRDTVSDLYHDRTGRLDFETLARLCRALDAQPGDLFAYAPPPAGR